MTMETSMNSIINTSQGSPKSLDLESRSALIPTITTPLSEHHNIDNPNPVRLHEAEIHAVELVGYAYSWNPVSRTVILVTVSKCRSSTNR